MRGKGFLACLAALAIPTGSLASSYSAYSTAVAGSARHVGLSGSNVAYPNGYSAAFVNPAGLSGMTGDGIDFGSDSNAVDDFVVDLDNPKARSLNVPLKYSYSGARYASTRGWGVGFVLQAPYDLDQTFINGFTRKPRRGEVVAPVTSQTELQMRIASYTLAAARQFGGGAWALGAALNYHRVLEDYDFSAAGVAPVHRDATRGAWSADLGVLARPRRWLMLGAAYRMGYRVPFSSSLNAGLSPDGTNFFREVKMPHRLAFGLAWLPIPDRLHLYLQSTYVPKDKDTVAAGTGLQPGTPSVAVGQYDTFDGRWGLEMVPIKKKDLTIKLWGGGYLEDTRVQGGYTRYHRTAGLQISPWFVDFSAAVDDAELYNNFSIGVGVDLLQVAQRVANTYGWKLPL